ncbi:sigma-70 family RNA polymerase sigma factor [Actinocorallia longicatena]|uniref:RNA polymerase sigma-70 factor (ECF subfamily) n=1 Tax=Actinocorallia longicatena TaxID=111803 RepID=A0ABP6QMA9_9ACTN
MRSPAEAAFADRTLVVERARAGCREAFGELYAEYCAAVHRYVLSRTGSPALAEDLTSETFLRALRRIESFTWTGRDFGAWLLTIARNLVADHYRSGRYRFETVTEAPPEGSVEGPERDVLDAFGRAMLLAAVVDLGEEQRQCVELRFFAERTVAETATIMDRKSGAVKALQHRAVRSLARRLPADPRSAA